MPDALELAQRAIECARSFGVDAEATATIAQRFSTEARDTVISKLQRSTGSSLSMRLFHEGRRATLVTSDFSNEGLRDAVHSAVEQCKVVASDPLAGLPDACASVEGELALFDGAILERDDASKIDDVLAMERGIRAADSRVTNSSGSQYSDVVSTLAHANTMGFAQSYRGTRASRSSGPVAEAEGVKRTAHYGSAGRAMRDLDACDVVAAQAAKRAVGFFGAIKPATMRVPVIFERDVAAAVLADVFAAVSASNVAVGNSWLADRVGERIGSSLVTIVDDGTLSGRLGSAPFDDEGVVTQRTPVFENGRLTSFLYDTYYARKLGAASTGNASGGGIGASNFYLEPGSQSLDALIASTGRGVLILETIGFATEHATGTYSRGARGFMIENGELSVPIEEFTIAGNFAEMLAAIDGVANDLRFDDATVSPSFRVAEMTISGN